MASRVSYLSLCAALAAGLGAYAASRIAPASAQAGASGDPQTLALPPKPNPDVRSSPEVRYGPPPAEPASGLPIPTPTPIAPIAPTAPITPLAPIAPARAATAPAPIAPAPKAPVPKAPAPIAPAPTGRVSPSNPSTGIVAINRSVPQPLGPNSPPPSSFENSCAPAPYVFQSKAGYEAVRVKDCTNDQLLYLPTSAQVQIDRYVAECRRRCGQ
jgi:hypothetical protein